MIAWFSRWFYYSFVIGAAIFGMLLCIFVLTKSVYLGGVYFYLVSWWSNRYNIPSGHLFLMLFSQYYYWSSTSFTFSQLYYCFWYGNVYFVVLYIFFDSVLIWFDVVLVNISLSNTKWIIFVCTGVVDNYINNIYINYSYWKMPDRWWLQLPVPLY